MSAPKVTAIALLAALAAPASAQEKIASPPDISAWRVDGSYDDAVFGLEIALQSRSLEVTNVAPVGATMAANMPVLGLGEPVYDKADVFSFCSLELAAVVTAVEPLALAFCPMRIFVMEIDGDVTLGFANLPERPLYAVAQTVLTDIATEAASGGF